MVDCKLRSGLDKKSAAQLLENIANYHLLGNPNAVFAKDNEVSAFGQYRIVESNKSFAILKRNIPVKELNSLRSALSWCIADKYHLTTLKDNIYNTDKELQRKQNDLLFYTHILKKSQDVDQKSALFDRYDECKDRMMWVKQRLNKYINSAKYWQQKGFDNETSRLGLQKHGRKITEGF